MHTHRIYMKYIPTSQKYLSLPSKNIFYFLEHFAFHPSPPDLDCQCCCYPVTNHLIICCLLKLEEDSNRDMRDKCFRASHDGYPEL